MDCSLNTTLALQPRKGSFEIRVGGTTIVSLLNMARPFTKLRELDLDATAAQVLAKLA